MEMLILSSVLLMLIPVRVQCFTCDQSAEWCETSLVIEHYITMYHPVHGAVYPAHGKLWKYDVTNTSEATPIDPGEVITTDGFEKQQLLVVANRSMPGPDIIVYEGQMLRIYVHNKLPSETVSIHWHGLPQRGTPYMDGAAFISQCPILPGDTFKYEFRARPKGTYFYHSHVGNQRAKGAFGALIIRDRKTNPINEHIIQIQEWNHEISADLAYEQMNLGIYIDRVQYGPTVTIDGTLFPPFLENTGLINGKGRFFSDKTGTSNGAPLEVYNVEKSKLYRFRLIAVAAVYPFRISVDGHPLLVVASDGHDVKPVSVESVTIQPGERFDFILDANQTAGNYWIRGKTLQINRNTEVKAILRYSGAPEEDPTSTQNCNKNNTCVVLNCPFSYYPKNTYTQCLTIDHLRADGNNEPVPDVMNGKFQEHFLNFILPQLLGTVNGVRFLNPTVSGISQPSHINSRCENEDCTGGKICSCTNSLDIHHGNTVQMVIFNMGPGALAAHPIHLHGHSFYLLKMGFGNYNETTGKYVSPNPDIHCPGGPSVMCRNATWSNASWANGNVPGLELENPILKDTIVVPVGSYVVVRFKADNPGLWMLHCHIQVDLALGMTILLNESFSELPDAPEGFPICGVYPSRAEYKTSTESQQTNLITTTPITATMTEGYVTTETFWIAVAILASIAFVQFLILFGLCQKGRCGSTADKYETKS